MCQCQGVTEKRHDFDILYLIFDHSSTETDIEDALKEAGGPMDEGISDIAKDSHFIINPSKASQEQARYMHS